MSSRSLRIVIALVFPVIALLIARWYDNNVLVDLQQREQMYFEVGAYANGLTIAHLGGGAAAVGVFIAAWWSRSTIVGLAYLVVGGFVVLIPALAAAFAIGVNGAAPVAPDPIARFLSDQWFSGLGAGTTGMALTIGGSMVVAGIAVLVARFRQLENGSPARLPELGSQPR